MTLTEFVAAWPKMPVESDDLECPACGFQSDDWVEIAGHCRHRHLIHIRCTEVTA